MTTGPCPEPELLAAFAEGRLSGAEADAIVAHLDGCEECRHEVALAMTAEPHEAPGTARRWPYALAAVIVLGLIGLATFRDALPFGRSPVGRLVALAPKSERLVEPRLTGGFAWAEYAGADRAAGGASDAERMQLTGAAGDLVARAERDPDAEAQHAAGVAMVLVQQPVEAIARLEKAAAESKDAKAWSDLAAARYAAATQLSRASLYPLALAAADQALRADGKLPEALFNRALILERMGLTDEAKRAWERYLAVDPSSPWAAEARAHLADLPAPRASGFDRDRPLLERAAERGDAAEVRRLVDAHRDRIRGFAESEYLAHWGAAVQRNDGAEAARWLAIARAAGDALAALSGETLVRDAVRAIERAPDAAAVADAHLAYRRARIAYSRHERAESDFLRAAAGFEAARSPMALVARYYAAGARLRRNDTSGARAELERLRAAADAHDGYISLRAHVRWELGRALMLDSDWSSAVAVLSEGAAMFQRSGERASEAFVESLLARALSSLGRNDDAWLARMRAFAALSAEGEPELLTTSVGAAMHAELRAGRREAALALSALELSVARTTSRPQLVIDALVNRAMLQSDAEAAREAQRIAHGTGDPALRARQLADVAVARGAALAERDPRGAVTSLTHAIDFYAAHELPFALPEPLLLRARSVARLGDTPAALRDLERGMSIVERHPAGETGVLDAEHALFLDAIRIALDHGDSAAAFAFAERARGAALTLAGLQQRLAGTGAVVLELVALPDELVTFAIAEHDFVVARRARASNTLAPLADAILSEADTTAASALYDEMIRPVEPLLARARDLVIVPDVPLESVPFAALYDSAAKRFLVERFAVSVAASAGSLGRETSANAPSLVTFTLPATDLPEVEREAGEVAALYRDAEAVPAARATLAALRTAAGADVVHIAGHTERQPGAGEPALRLAGDERVSWKNAVRARGVVVLAACETLRRPASDATRALSLGGAFSAAGAPAVVGTLAPIGDRDARFLFRALHRHLASGARAADALRAAQQEAIEREREHGGRRAWRAVALMTRTIPAQKEPIAWARTN